MDIGFLEAGYEVVLGVVAAALAVACAFMWAETRRLRREKAAAAAAAAPSRGLRRIRKRDRVMFHSKRLMRSVGETVGNVMASAAGSKSVGERARLRALKKLSSGLLQYYDYSGSEEDEEREDDNVIHIRPAEEYLEEDHSLGDNAAAADLPTGPVGQGLLTPGLTYLLDCLHSFGVSDKAAILELCKSIQSVAVPAGEAVFEVGDPDEFMYVVERGRVGVYVTDTTLPASSGSSSRHVIKVSGPGETITSHLSFIEYLSNPDRGGDCHYFKTVSSRALSDSVCFKVPFSAFARLYGECPPEALVSTVQLITARLQRVVFVGLHRYLGLTSELIGDQQSDADEETMEYDSAFTSTAESSLESIGGGIDSATVVDGNNNDCSMTTAARKIMIETAAKGFEKELGVKLSADYLAQKLILRTLPEGSVIMTEDCHEDAALVYILSGSLVTSQSNDGDGSASSDRVLYTAVKGECVGQLAVLTGEANFYTCSSKETSRVAILPRTVFAELTSERPEIVLSLVRQILARLSPLIREVDFALDWINIEGGKALYSQGTATDGTFIVLSGRLRSSVSKKDAATKASSRQLVAEYSHGDMVGLVEVITNQRRLTGVTAARDSELCKIPGALFKILRQKHPVVVSKLVSLLGNHLIGSWSSVSAAAASARPDKRDSTLQPSYATVALFAATEDVPLTAFALELEQALSAHGPVRRISSDVVASELGASVHDYKLNSWLSAQEHRHKVVVYQCDKAMNKWTAKCIRHADVVFDVVMAAGGGSPRVSSDERQLAIEGRRVRKELVLLHDVDTPCPSGTSRWLKLRPWVSSHFHLKPTRRMFTRRTMPRLLEFYRKEMSGRAPSLHSDFSRLARHITGTSIGVVLGGGGARGAAHLGILKAMQEAGIPVDKIGGVSIGALVSGLYAISRDVDAVTEKTAAFFEMQNWRHFLDLTYPVCSISTGHHYNYTMRATFGADLEIEDFWLPYFCCTTDVSTSRQRVHTSGVFWKYCRASTSYAWFLPPLCDPVDGHLLMDGCYVNNVPGDVMAAQGCKYIMAVDVTALDDRNLYNYGETLSGWRLLANRLNPFAATVKIPDQSEIQLRLAFCSHYKNLDELMSNPNYEYIKPPVDKYSGTKVGRAVIDEIREVGYSHGTTLFAGLRKYRASRSKSAGQSPPWSLAPDKDFEASAQQRRNSGYTLNDIANIVCGSLEEDDLDELTRPDAAASSAAAKATNNRRVDIKVTSPKAPTYSRSVSASSVSSLDLHVGGVQTASASHRGVGLTVGAKGLLRSQQHRSLRSTKRLRDKRIGASNNTRIY